MTGLIQSIKDGVLIVRTDKRFAVAGGFLCTVLLLWGLTSAWREPEPEKEKVNRYIKPEDEIFNESLVDFRKDIDLNRETRAQLGEVLKRTESDLQTNQQQIDWTFNSLLGKLDNMANRVDELATKIGTRSIERAEIDRKIELHNKKKKKVVKKVDQGEL